jgi:hypothetical protein
MSLEISNAITRLHPKAQFVITMYGDEYTIDWHSIDIPQPTKEEIEQSILLLKSQKYKEKRAGEYPSVGDQLDALFHAGLFPQEMADKIQAVKDKYPKPE